MPEIPMRKRWFPEREKGRLQEDGQLHELYGYDSEKALYATDPDWIAGVGDVEVQLALVFELMDMLEATGEEKEFEDCPIAIEAYIMVAYPGAAWMMEADTESRLDEVPPENVAQAALEMSKQYGGGVPVFHILLDEIKGGGSDIARFRDREDVCWKTTKVSHGTVAAQRGPGAKFRYPMFANFDVAREFAEELMKRAPAMMRVKIGFILDRPINMAGEPGWNTIEKQMQ